MFALLSFILTIGFAWSAPRTSVCRPADSFSAGMIQHLNAVVTGTDTGNTRLRQAYRLLPVTTSPAVTLVTDESECLLAKAAVEGRFTDGTTTSQVYVFRIGTTRIAASAAKMSRDQILIDIFDSSYNYLTTLQM